MSANPWDLLAGVFSVDQQEQVPANAADNILIAWPPILDILSKEVLPPSRVLDFGCGGGRLAAELKRRGYETVGIDPSVSMINGAREAFGADVDFHVGSTDDVNAMEPFSAVIAVMVFQFIDDVESAIATLAGRLTPNGLLIFAVHNPACVKALARRGETMVGFESSDNPQRGRFQFANGTSVPIVVRTAADYDAIASKAHLHRVAQAEPLFTDDFIRKYPEMALKPIEHSEYLILGYKRNGSSK